MSATPKSVEVSLCNAANYVGNRPSNSLDLVGPDKKTLREKYLIGEPRDCPVGTAEEMKARGFVGIYRKEVAKFYRLPNSNRVVPKTW
jgi:hypothetical protein